MLNPQQIRRALVRLAQFKQRPHYEPMFVRSVIEGFETHPLKWAVLYFCEHCPEEHKARYNELLAVCRNDNVVRKLSELSGIDVRSILLGECMITNSAWLALKKHFDGVE